MSNSMMNNASLSPNAANLEPQTSNLKPPQPTPNPQPPTPDPKRQRLAREYAAIRRWLFFVDLGLGVLLVGGLLFSGASAAIRTWAAGLVSGEWWWAVVLLYVGVLGVAYTLITLPLGFYSGYVLPHRY